MLIAVIVVLVLLVAGIVFTFLRNGKDTRAGITDSLSNSLIATPDGTYSLKGTIGNLPVFMQVTIRDGRAYGSYFYTTSSPDKPLFLEGSFIDGGLDMDESNDDDLATAKWSGRFDGSVYSGIFLNITNGKKFQFRLSKTSETYNGRTTKRKSVSAGLTLRTFTEKSSDNGQPIKAEPLDREQMVANLKAKGFRLLQRKTEKRADYTGEDYYDAVIEKYSKTVGDNTTTVKLETDYTEIRFPNLKDVEEFKASVVKCGLKRKGDTYEDNPDVYWTGTDVTFKGTIVSLNYRWEP